MSQTTHYIDVNAQRLYERGKIVLYPKHMQSPLDHQTKIMTQINAYLNFNGRCREALSFYRDCLGGELNLQKIAESPMAAQMPSEMGAHILHGTLINKGIILMGSDMIGNSLVPGNSISLCLQCSDEEEIARYFEKLSAAGTVKTPLHQTVWGATYGELTDKFGVQWLLNYAKN